TRPVLFEKMWAEHSKKPAVSNLDKRARKEEEGKIRNVIEALGIRLPYIKPSRQVVEFQQLYRSVEATPETEYLTVQFAEKLEALRVQLKLGKQNGIPRGDIVGGKALFERLRMK